MSVTIEDDDKLWNEILADIKEIGNYGVDVGPVADGKGNSKIIVYAAANEFGANIKHKNGKVTRIPERSFMRSTFDDNGVIDKVINRFARLFGQMLDGRNNAVDVMGGTGDAMAAEIQAKITSNVSPVNAPSTIKRKGSGKGTLTDSFDMLRSITRKVFKK